MRIFSSERWLVVGGAILGAGALLAISWFIYIIQAQKNQSYWSTPGVIGATVSGVGLIMLVIGFFLPKEGKEEPHSSQVQHGKRNSINLQAGRDIRFGKKG